MIVIPGTEVNCLDLMYDGKPIKLSVVNLRDEIYVNIHDIVKYVCGIDGTKLSDKVYVLKKRNEMIKKACIQVRVDAEHGRGKAYIPLNKIGLLTGILNTKFDTWLKDNVYTLPDQSKIQSQEWHSVFELVKDLIGSHDFEDVQRDLRTFDPRKSLVLDPADMGDVLYNHVMAIVGKYVAPKNYDLVRDRIDSYEAAKFSASIDSLPFEDLVAICDKNYDAGSESVDESSESTHPPDKNASNRKRRYQEAFRSVRRKMPKIVRNHVWFNVIGDFTTGKCFVCQEKVHMLGHWHCSHIIAKSLGGSDKIDNLTICCAQCNLSMGTRNLNEFKESYF